MNIITKFISVVLLALTQATAFAYEVGDTITENGVKYILVDKYFYGRYCVDKKNVEDIHMNLYVGRVLAVATDKTRKDICLATNFRYITNGAFPDSVPTVEQYSLVGINDNAFADEELESITVPEGLRHIGSGAFRNMKVDKGSLWMPFVWEYGEGVFSGLRADLVFTSSWIKPFDERIYTKFKKTFEPAESLPKIIVRTSELRNFSKSKGWPVDSMLCYGSAILNEKERRERDRISCNVERNSYNKRIYRSLNYPAISLSKKSSSSRSFLTSSSGVMIEVKKKKFSRKEINPYTVYNDVRDYYATPYFYYYKGIESPTFVMNGMFFRLENNGQYVYFTLDGKKMEYSLVANEEGFDPFGTRIISKEEIEKRKAKEVNIKKLDKKTDDLMKRFGF